MEGEGKRDRGWTKCQIHVIVKCYCRFNICMQTVASEAGVPLANSERARPKERVTGGEGEREGVRERKTESEIKRQTERGDMKREREGGGGGGREVDRDSSRKTKAKR